MIYKNSNLKWYRKQAKLTLKDVATLLGTTSSQLIRYESGLRKPTPEIVISYHILFGASMRELLSPLVKKVQKQLVGRSIQHMNYLKENSPSKSQYTIDYIGDIVNILKQKQHHESSSQ